VQKTVGVSKWLKKHIRTASYIYAEIQRIQCHNSYTDNLDMYPTCIWSTCYERVRIKTKCVGYNYKKKGATCDLKVVVILVAVRATWGRLFQTEMVLRTNDN